MHDLQGMTVKSAYGLDVSDPFPQSGVSQPVSPEARERLIVIKPGRADRNYWRIFGTTVSFSRSSPGAMWPCATSRL